MAKKRRTYTREFKIEAVRMVTEGGLSLAQAARDLGIGAHCLSRWKAELTASGEAFPGKGRSPAEVEELNRLRRRVKQLEMEREFLKEAAAYFAKESEPGTPASGKSGRGTRSR